MRKTSPELEMSSCEYFRPAASNAAVTSLLPGERNPSASAPAQDQNAQTRTKNRVIFRFKEKHFLSLIDNSIAEKF